MILNKGAVEILRKMYSNGSYMSYKELEEIKNFDQRDFRIIFQAGFLDVHLDGKELAAMTEKQIFDSKYLINSAGIAYLESLEKRTWEEIRAWIAIALSFSALLLSIISIFLK